ncbi:MAG: hypothetical protein PHS41_01390 [Victivallaceae bacterium]|nr:hypothetical protein [Victivallaceae bacterium]
MKVFATMTPTSDCQLSIVITARNDDYAGNFMDRLTLFQNALAMQTSRRKRAVELIVVEWNPLSDRPGLADAIAWNPQRDYLKIRIITIGKETHESYVNSRKMPVLEYPGKNIGIRRATSKWVLTTNPDIVFSSRLMDLLLSGTLDENTVYRTDRFDYQWRDVLSSGKLSEKAIENVMESQVFMCYAAASSYPVRSDLRRAFYRLSGFWPCSMKFKGLRKSIFRPSIIRHYYKTLWEYSDQISIAAPGDFTLATKAAFERCHGYFETIDTFTGLDLIMCHQMQAAGMRQCIFLYPCVIYHADHSRAAQQNRNPLTQLPQILSGIDSGEIAYNINAEDWGRPNDVFSEQIL